MSISLGLSLGERLSLEEYVEQSIFCDENGFDSIWVAEGRLTRDAIGPSAVIAHRTKRIKIGTGVVNTKTRNAALMAVTFKTLDDFAPDRIILGLGAWWEPLATRVGLPLRKPLTDMREYITVIKKLFANETVNFQGEFVSMTDVRFDMMYRDNRVVNVPVYVGAVRPKMLELSGEIADGVLLDFLVPPEYVREAVKHVETGIARRGDGTSSIDLPQLVACSVNDRDPQAAIDACKAFLTMYLAQQPHIAAYSGVDPELVAQIQEEMGWPARPEELERTMRLVPNGVVQNVAACGTRDDAVAHLERYQDAGSTCAVLCALGDGKFDTVKAIAEAAA